ncbi:sensor histidine kinase [Amnibacterium setariae]|uniref:ATP-binding protein n=1 Tax=Amnibacterium setariae TaxID=2306585 RepID=A0A3A1TS90_9MICO|nr:hypothetical protein [Amnibacterium setariae]RIX26565.1 hypothetical protein D1781_16725 [Amnibacterium setariae]
MTTDAPEPSTPAVGAARFQRYLGVIVGAFGVLYALQTLDALVAGWPTMAGPVGGAAVALVGGSVLLGTVAAAVPSRGRSLFLGAAILFCAAVAVWPFSLTGPVPETPMPWFIGLLPVEAAFLATAFRRPAASLSASAALSVGIATVLVVRGGLSVADAVANALFGIVISLVLVVLISAVRRGVERADAAQQAALDGYGRSRLDDATEHERTRTDALVHDSVLTTFLAAAAARDPESEELARRMAANALRVLAHVNQSGATGPVVPLSMALGEAVERFDPLILGWEVEVGALGDLVLPADAAEALIASMVHAMSASVLHAEGATVRSITMAELGADGIRVVLADDGRGFDPREGRDPRVEALQSVVELMRSVDGRADIRTGAGTGTVVTLSWGSIVISGTAPRPERTEVPA